MLSPRLLTRCSPLKCLEQLLRCRGVTTAASHDPSKIRNMALVAHIGEWIPFAYLYTLKLNP
jgi:hypothetical protein